MTRSHRAGALVVVLALLAPLVAVLTGVAGPAPSARAADLSQFNPGYIISDANFYDGGAMTADQVQQFLAAKEPRCSGSVPCMKNWTGATQTMAPSVLCPGGYAGSPSERAADIIAKVGAACNISQKALLVTLQKEQSLVTSGSPSARAYSAALGFGCPDTAPCDPAVAGFFYQMYFGARQFQNYARNPGSFNYIAGRVNYILNHPNCPTRVPVFIQNKATAGLYDYTPYVPNANAIAGGGDCASFGNLNFYRYYTDWFGLTTGAANLLRTVDAATVYLVTDTSKYPIPSREILATLAPLGPVGYVSQSYLDRFTTKQNVGHALRSPDGTIYFYDSGIKLPFTSCAQAVDYGASCELNGYVQLTDAQAAAFYTGPLLSSVMGTVEGGRYYIHAGTKSEILDDASQSAAGIPFGMNVLTEAAISYLPVAAPIVRDGVFATARDGRATWLLSSASRWSVAASDASALGVAARTAGSLWSSSLASIPTGATAFSGLIRTSDGGIRALAADGSHPVTAGGLSATAPIVPVSATFSATYPDASAISAGTFLISPAGGTVYVVMPADIRPIASWDALVALTPPGSAVRILTVPQAVISGFVTGPVALQSGTLVRSPQNPTVYLMNGVTDRIAFSSFVYPNEAGFTSFSYADQGRLDAYPVDAKLVGFGFLCGSDHYVGAGGSLHLVSTGQVGLFPFDWVQLDSFVCARARIGAPAGSFIRTPEGSIYQLVDGQKRPISTMARFAQLSGGQGWLDVVPQFGSLIPTGPLA